MDDSDQQPLVGLPAPVAGPTLDRAYVEAVAHRVAELIRDEAQQTVDRRLVDAATLAAELGVERSWVYEHRDELHPVRLGNGSKPRLRFDVPAVRAALAAQNLAEPRPHGSFERGGSRASARRRTRRQSRSTPTVGQ
ncbi:MAG TPA: hypothetical protein VKI23_06450, partial [Cellulomonadaceae bacterium]|nr:hypothetical protein [Cellulomonadaceae bacterium]